MAVYLFLHMSVIFSGNASMTLLPFSASHGNMKLLPKVLSHVNDKRASRLFLKVRTEFFAVPCFWRTIFLSWSAGFRKSRLSECKFQWWPEDTHWWDTRAASLWIRWAGSTRPMLGGLLLSVQRGLDRGTFGSQEGQDFVSQVARRIFKELPLWEVIVSLKSKCTTNIQLDFTWIFFWKKIKEKMSK